MIDALLGLDEKTDIGAFQFLATDAGEIAWNRVQQISYLIRQHFRYEYPGPISNLQQRLIVIPPERHGDQRLVMHKLECSSHSADLRREIDQFGNLIINLTVDHIAEAIDFTAWVVVERSAMPDPNWVDPRLTSDAIWTTPTALTTPDAAIATAANELKAMARTPLELARLINRFVFERMHYLPGSTSIESTAAEVFAGRIGVCQDSAHLMLALCRAVGLPCRYISGHLLGEGATHAWVDLLLPDESRPGRTIAWAFDPTHGNEPGFDYVTVAAGRDYGDVTPTSGAFWAPYPGRLIAAKLAGALAVHYR